MRLKQGDGPLQAVHNGNNDILNSPKRINTIQNSNYTQNTQNSTLYGNVTTNEITNITKNIQQLTIEEVAALNNVHNDTQELQWYNSDLTTTGGQDTLPLNFQRQLALTNLANNRLNINSNLAARLRLRAQNAQNAPPAYEECVQMPQSPDDIPIDEDAHQSCSSSVSASPQDEDRAFDPSDSAESSDEGNDYPRPKSTDIRPNTLKGFVNPNYPGFQHLAHTLDFDDETLNNANNNNEEYEIADKFDSVNRLDSVENIQKVFHDKSLDIDVDRAFPSATETDQESPNGSSSANCDSESECGGPIDNSASNDDSGGTVNENFNILIDEKKVIGGADKEVDAIDHEECEVTIKENDIKQSDIIKVNINDESGIKTESIVLETANDNTNTARDDRCIDSVVGNFRKEVEDELGRVYAKDHFEDPFEPGVIKSTEIELEEAVEKLQVLSNFQPSAANYSIQPNTDQPFSKEPSPTVADQLSIGENNTVIKNDDHTVTDEYHDGKMVVSTPANIQNMSTSLKPDSSSMEIDDGSKIAVTADSAIVSHPIILETSMDVELSKNVPELPILSEPSQLKNKITESVSLDDPIQEKRVRKQVPSYLPLNHTSVHESSRNIISPIENKMADASLSTCQDHISKIIVERPYQLQSGQGVCTKPLIDAKLMNCSKTASETRLMEVDEKLTDEGYKRMDVDGRLGMDLGRRDSNRELEEIEIQIKKIKSDTMCNMEEAERLRKEDITKRFQEKDEDSSMLRRNPAKMSTYVKKRRDYNQQFGSLITFPKRDAIKRDPLNRRSVPMVRDRKKMTNPEYLGGFDVYNIETAMPKIDLEAIECHLRAAREEERRVSQCACRLDLRYPNKPII